MARFRLRFWSAQIARVAQEDLPHLPAYDRSQQASEQLRSTVYSVSAESYLYARRVGRSQKPRRVKMRPRWSLRYRNRDTILALIVSTPSMRPELIQAADLLRRNTPEAVDEAIGLLQNTVYSFSMKVCGHPEDAEDTMQEVLSRSLRAPCEDSGPAGSRGLALHRHPKPLLAHAPQGSFCSQTHPLAG